MNIDLFAYTQLVKFAPYHDISTISDEFERESMAIDIAAVCATTSANGGGQTLAFCLSVIFVACTVATVTISAHTILVAAERKHFKI